MACIFHLLHHRFSVRANMHLLYTAFQPATSTGAEQSVLTLASHICSEEHDGLFQVPGLTCLVVLVLFHFDDCVGGKRSEESTKCYGELLATLKNSTCFLRKG